MSLRRTPAPTGALAYRLAQVVIASVYSDRGEHLAQGVSEGLFEVRHDDFESEVQKGVEEDEGLQVVVRKMFSTNSYVAENFVKTVGIIFGLSIKIRHQNIPC